MSQSPDRDRLNRRCSRVAAYSTRPRRCRPVNPHAAANELAMRHQDIADKVAGNISGRTGHPVEDLRQIAMMGIIRASRRYEPKRGGFRAYARVYANGEVYHYLRDKGFIIRLPAGWRELNARQELMRLRGASNNEIANSLGISKRLLLEIRSACCVRVVPLASEGGI